jgi:predicted O-methyltransferase YrrM
MLRAVLDDRIRAVLERLEREDAEERERGLPASERSRQVAHTTGQFLLALVAPQTDCEVLEIGGSRGYSTIWLAAGARNLGGHVLSLESDPRKIEAWRANIAAAALDEWADLVEGDAHETLAAIDDVFDLVFLDGERRLRAAVRACAREGGAGRADRGRQRPLALRPARAVFGGPTGRPDPRVRDRPARPRARAECRAAVGGDAGRGFRYRCTTAERRWSGSDFIKYGQWRYQRVEVCPRNPRGIA